MCGRFVSLRFFDPRSFESDIYAVDVRGLGRGKGVEVVSRISVLDVPEILVPIKDRCRELIRIIDGNLPLTKDEVAAVNKDLQKWRKSALDLQKQGIDQEAQLVEMESSMLHWKREAHTLERRNLDLEAKIADDESTIRRLMNQTNNLNVQVRNLTRENSLYAKKIESLREEGELALEELDEVLVMINEETNEDFEDLHEAVSFLLETG